MRLFARDLFTVNTRPPPPAVIAAASWPPCTNNHAMPCGPGYCMWHAQLLLRLGKPHAQQHWPASMRRSAWVLPGGKRGLHIWMQAPCSAAWKQTVSARELSVVVWTLSASQVGWLGKEQKGTSENKSGQIKLEGVSLVGFGQGVARWGKKLLPRQAKVGMHASIQQAHWPKRCCLCWQAPAQSRRVRRRVPALGCSSSSSSSISSAAGQKPNKHQAVSSFWSRR